MCDKSQIAVGMHMNGKKEVRVYLRVWMKREEKDESYNQKETTNGKKRRVVVIEDRSKGQGMVDKIWFQIYWKMYDQGHRQSTGLDPFHPLKLTYAYEDELDVHKFGGN